MGVVVVQLEKRWDVAPSRYHDKPLAACDGEWARTRRLGLVRRTTAVAEADDRIRRMRTVDTIGQTVTSDTIHPTKYKVLRPWCHLSAVCHPP